MKEKRKGKIKYFYIYLQDLAQLTNAEIANLNIMSQVQTQDLTYVCEFQMTLTILSTYKQKYLL